MAAGLCVYEQLLLACKQLVLAFDQLFFALDQLLLAFSPTITGLFSQLSLCWVA